MNFAKVLLTQRENKWLAERTWWKPEKDTSNTEAVCFQNAQFLMQLSSFQEVFHINFKLVAVPHPCQPASQIILILTNEIHYKEPAHLPVLHFGWWFSSNICTIAFFSGAFSHSNYLTFPQKCEQINVT